MDEQVTLASYADQVRELIRHDRNDEAIAICKHILRYYPKYIDAYRQMGEALLEKRDYDGAKDVFQRVLSADPENAIAYVGLSTIFEQEHLVDEAVWNMERAFELAPGNAELQKELVRLYNALDIKPHARAKLTPGALARIYAQEGLFDQAIQEFRAIIAGMPSRFDIRVALAEALWRMGRLSEAAQVAQSILEQLPYCLKANLILGAAWKEAGLVESDVYLQRAQMLDPMNHVAARLFGARAPSSAPPSVPRYVEGADSLPVKIAPSETQAVTSFENVETEPPGGFAPAEAVAEIIAEEPSAPLTAEDNLPVWLRRAPSETVEKTELPREDSSDWLSKLREMPAEETSAPPEASAPAVDWLNLPKTEESAPPESPDEKETLPTWLDSALPESTTQPAAETETTPAPPDWLRGLPEPSAPITPTSIEELPSWLAPADSSIAPPAEQEEVPAWLASSIVPPVTESEPAQEVTEAPTPDWLSPLQEPAQATETSKPKEEMPSEARAPDWLSKLQEPAQVVEPSAPPAIIEPTVGFESPPLAEPAPLAPPAETPSIVVEMPTPPGETMVVEKPVEPKRKRQPKGYGHLVQARAHRDAQRWNDALVEYDYVVQHAPRLVREVIDDLEVLIQRIDIPLEAHRILGDAYTRVDRLAEALERYRFVLEHVS